VAQIVVAALASGCFVWSHVTFVTGLKPAKLGLRSRRLAQFCAASGRLARQSVWSAPICRLNRQHSYPASRDPDRARIANADGSSDAE
jgi:hypothetical protein